MNWRYVASLAIAAVTVLATGAVYVLVWLTPWAIVAAAAVAVGGAALAGWVERGGGG